MFPNKFMYLSSEICENCHIESGYQGISAWSIGVVTTNILYESLWFTQEI